jgi:hypothetical protein
MTDNVCSKTTIYNQVMSKRKEKADAQNKTNQRATKKRRISKATKNAEQQSSADGDVEHNDER